MALAPVSRRELITRLRRLGFDGPFPGTKHAYMERGDVDVRIPNPHERDIGAPFLRSLLKQAGVSEEEWESTR